MGPMGYKGIGSNLGMPDAPTVGLTSKLQGNQESAVSSMPIMNTSAVRGTFGSSGA